MRLDAGSRAAAGRGRLLLAAIGLLSSMVLTACGGSALDPSEVLRANALVRGGAPATNPGGTGVVVAPGTTGSQPIAGTPVTPGVPGPGTTRTSGTPGTPGERGGAAQVTTSAKAGSCAGFTNQTGINDSTITLANISDLTGPIPGIFASAKLASQAYVQFFNSTSSICGRKLAILSLDSQTNAGADNTAWQKACESAFAGVGSMSAFDSGGAATTQRCGIPDLRAIQTNAARTACTTCFSAEGAGLGQNDNVIADYFLAHHHDATQKAAAIYVDEAASASTTESTIRDETKRGWRFVYDASFGVAEFNYGPYVQKMKSAGVRLVQFLGSSDEGVRMVKAFQAADFKPEVVLMGASSYDPVYAGGGSATDGTIVAINFVPLEEVARNPEMQLYDQWLQQVSPGARMSYYGLYSWSATRLLVEQAVALGGRLTRAAVLQRIRGVQNWTGHGLHSPQDVGTKGASGCWRFVQLQHGAWRPYGGTRFACGGR